MVDGGVAVFGTAREREALSSSIKDKDLFPQFSLHASCVCVNHTHLQIASEEN